LNELKWEGVAMVEFKKDNITNTFNLMEINAKFWGSLDLALVCGANFPQMMIDDALGNKFELWNLKNKRFQWLLNGDLYYLVERPLHILKFIRELLFSKNDIWISDLAPNIYQLFYIPVHFYKKWFK
jgi:predicted ATP-grasp superfamily ATP-dependent carboligase